MTTTPPEPTFDMTSVANRVMYELLGRRWVYPYLQVVDAYPARREIILAGRPVREVVSVTAPDGTAITGWELSSGFRLDLPYGSLRRCSTCTRQEVKVEYVYGSKPPEQVRYAIEVLKDQLELAVSGSSECRLPKRITSIARQGISMTILDPQDYLEKGRTGLPEVDAALMAFNRSGAKARARLFTSNNPPPRRLSVTTIPPETTP